MARPCTVCTSLDVDAVNLALSGETPVKAVARKFGLSPDAVRRHHLAHLTPALVALARERRNEVGAVSIYDRLEDLTRRCSHLLDMAQRKGALVASAQLVRELRSILETLGRITGELDDKPQLTVINLQTSPEWIAVRGALMAALAPYQEARLAVAAALSGRQAGEPAALPMTTVDTFAVPTDVPTERSKP
jgi:transposase-like protein